MTLIKFLQIMYYKILFFAHVDFRDHIASKYLHKIALLGDAWGQHEYGYFLATGKGIPKNESEAIKWYRKAAEKGHAPSQCNLGIIYLHGLGIEQNQEEGEKWIKLAEKKWNYN